MAALHALRACWRLVQKDVAQEMRARRAAPSMLLLGLALILLLGMQIDLPAIQKQRIGGGILWMAVFFAGTLALERSFAGEREEGCWAALLLYPISPSVVFFAKVTVNFLAVTCLEIVLVPALTVFANLPLLDRPGPLILVAVLANLGFVSLGVVVSAVTAGMFQRSGLLALLLLPLLVPVLLGAAEATRLILLGELTVVWWRWVQLLGAFAVMYTTLGVLVFELAIEE
jgi:heme exporter protein B